MPPTIKKPVNFLSEMVCNRCVFSLYTEADCFCVNMNSSKTIPPIKSDNFYCSEGIWLFSRDDLETVQTVKFIDLYELFVGKNK